LRGKHGTDQGTCAGYRREMMAVKHVPICRHVIEAVIMTLCGCGARSVDAEGRVGDKQAIETIRDEIDANRGDNEPSGIDRFPPVKRNNCKRHGAQQSDRCP
jgi:hypothetical protein